jgi:hypothetical protein
MELDAYSPSKTIKSYKIWLEKEGGIRVSEYKNYVVDLYFREFRRYFLFKNSFGKLD